MAYYRGGQLILLGGHFWKAAFSEGPYLLIEIEPSLWEVSLSTKLEDMLDLKIFSECFRRSLKMLQRAKCGPRATNCPPLAYYIPTDYNLFFLGHYTTIADPVWWQQIQNKMLW